MRAKIVIASLLILLFSTVSLNAYSINRPVIENDEGIYTNTFLLVNKGYKLYKEVFFSQPPAFFFAVYPGFILFGKTVAAARLTIFLWVMIGLISLTLLAGRDKLKVFLPIFLLFSIPSFYRQIVTFQSDALSPTFSLLSLICMWKCIKSQKKTWLLFSSVFLTLAFWTKFDVTIIVPSLLLILQIKKNRVVHLLVFLVAFSLVSFLLIFPFGLQNIIDNVVLLRTQAINVYPLEPLMIFELFKQDLLLLFLFLLNVLFFIFKKQRDILTKSLLLWMVVSAILLFLFRPLFPHHLVFFTIPLVVSFSFQIFHFDRLFRILLFLFVGLSFFNVISTIPKGSPKLPKDYRVAIQVITRLSRQADFVVSDEAMLNTYSQRLPPPPLADLSSVRIKSGNISKDRFKAIIQKYHPKLIISWNGRLASMDGLEATLADYALAKTINDKKLYLLRR